MPATGRCTGARGVGPTQTVGRPQGQSARSVITQCSARARSPCRCHPPAAPERTQSPARRREPAQSHMLKMLRASVLSKAQRAARRAYCKLSKTAKRPTQPVASHSDCPFLTSYQPPAPNPPPRALPTPVSAARTPRSHTRGRTHRIGRKISPVKPNPPKHNHPHTGTSPNPPQSTIVQGQPFQRPAPPKTGWASKHRARTTRRQARVSRVSSRNPGAVSSSARRSPSDQPTPIPTPKPPAKPKPQGAWSKPCAPPKPAPPRPRSCEWTLASRLAHAPTCLHSSAPGPCRRAACLLTRDHLTRDTKSCPLPASRSIHPAGPLGSRRLSTRRGLRFQICTPTPPTPHTILCLCSVQPFPKANPTRPTQQTNPTSQPDKPTQEASPTSQPNKPTQQINPTKGTPGASHHRRLFSCHLSPNPTPTTAPTWLARNPQARLCSPSRRAIPFRAIT